MKVTSWFCQNITIMNCLTFGGNIKILNLRILMNLRTRDRKWLSSTTPHFHDGVITSVFSYKLTTVIIVFILYMRKLGSIICAKQQPFGSSTMIQILWPPKPLLPFWAHSVEAIRVARYGVRPEKCSHEKLYMKLQIE